MHPPPKDTTLLGHTVQGEREGRMDGRTEVGQPSFPQGRPNKEGGNQTYSSLTPTLSRKQRWRVLCDMRKCPCQAAPPTHLDNIHMQGTCPHAYKTKTTTLTHPRIINVPPGKGLICSSPSLRLAVVLWSFLLLSFPAAKVKGIGHGGDAYRPTKAGARRC